MTVCAPNEVPREIDRTIRIFFSRDYCTSRLRSTRERNLFSPSLHGLANLASVSCTSLSLCLLCPIFTLHLVPSVCLLCQKSVYSTSEKQEDKTNTYASVCIAYQLQTALIVCDSVRTEHTNVVTTVARSIVPHYYRRFFFFGLVPIYVRLLFPLFASPCSLHFRRLARILTDAVSVLPPRVSRTWRTYFSLSRGVFSPVRQLVTDHRRGRYRRRLSKVHATEKAGVCSFFKKPEFAWGTRKIGYGGNVVKIKGNT